MFGTCVIFVVAIISLDRLLLHGMLLISIMRNLLDINIVFRSFAYRYNTFAEHIILLELESL